MFTNKFNLSDYYISSEALASPAHCLNGRGRMIHIGKSQWGTFGVMMCQSRLTDCNKCTILVGEAVHVWGQGAYGKSLYFPLNYAMNLKLL